MEMELERHPEHSKDITLRTRRQSQQSLVGPEVRVLLRPHSQIPTESFVSMTQGHLGAKAS